MSVSLTATDTTFAAVYAPASTTVLLSDMGFHVECSRCITPRDCKAVYAGKFTARAAADQHARICRPPAPDLDHAAAVNLASSYTPRAGDTDDGLTPGQTAWARAWVATIASANTLNAQGDDTSSLYPWHQAGEHPGHGGPLVWVATALDENGTPIVVALVDDLPPTT